MKAAVREAVGSDPVPPPPPKLGPAVVDPPHPAVPPRAAALAPRSAGWGYVIAWSLGIGVGAVAAGAFVGFLVNGPPSHTARDRIIADVAPPTPDVPPPTAQEIIASKSASAAPVLLTNAPATTTVTTTKAASMSLPPIPPARPAAQPAPPSHPPSPPLSSGDMREVQGRLQSLGFDPGPLDGSAGPRTSAAITRYQQTHGLAETGVADKDMLDGLRQQPGSTAPPPPPRPRPQTYQYAAAPPPPRQSNPFVDALNRMFGR